MNIGHFYHNLQFCTTLLLLITRSLGPREKIRGITDRIIYTRLYKYKLAHSLDKQKLLYCKGSRYACS